jgi:pimeloyl-ACP methyl ester carboxylesterase
LASPALISDPTFDRFTDLIEGPLAQLGVANAYLYVHDFGTPVALNLAMRDPRGVLGLIVQNANANCTVLGPSWRDTIDYWMRQRPRTNKAQQPTSRSKGRRTNSLAACRTISPRAIPPTTGSTTGA